MKKSLALGVLAAVLFSGISANANITVTEVSKRRVTANISVNPLSDVNFASAAVVPYDFDGENFEIENDTLKNVFYITKETDDNGELDITFVLPDGFENGQYCAVSYDGGEKYISRIGIADESFGADLVLANSAKSASELKAAVENFEFFNVGSEIFSSYGDGICEYVFAAKPDNGYTAEGFIKEYFTAEALLRYSDKKISFYKFLTEYSAYLGIDYKNTFAALTQEGFDEADRLFSKRAEKGISDVSKTLDEIYKTAEIKKCKTAKELCGVYLEGAQSRNVDMTDYNSLDDYKKESVFLKMLSELKNADTIEEADKIFLSLSKEYADTGSGNNSSSSSSSGGGRSNGISAGAGINVSPVLPADEKTYFSDISQHWAKEYIKTLSDTGIVNGFDDNTFKPDNNVTRAEFTKIVCRMFDITGGGEPLFDDVKPSDWYYGFVCSAYGAKIVSGYENLFSPEGYITREDAAVILNRILKLGANGNLSFADADKISPYAKSSVCALFENGITQGYPDNTFNPKGFITRAEASVLITKASKQK